MKPYNLCILFSFILLSFSMFSLTASFFYWFNTKVVMLELDLFSQLNSLMFSYLILLDWMSLLFMSAVSLIAGVAMIYSYSYMSEDSQKNSFYTLVLLFVISMFLMVMSPHMLSILLGWDGLGLVSYCLVIYYKNNKSQNAGMVTFLSNRLGDLGIIIAISWLLNFGSLNYLVMQNLFFYNASYVFYAVVLAAMTKSAQIPFSAWLPAAMAAPTPVSSLVHSSTLVTAGVYLLIRFNFLVNLNFYLIIFSCLTMTMSGLSALFETDMKKVIALSTLSQLGVMMFSLSIGMKEMAFFHLLTHALFKSLLFLCAGFFIHSNQSWQDVRSFSKIYKLFPLSGVYFSVASLALSGFPFLSGFYSKDMIIELFFFYGSGHLIFFLLVASTFMTFIYSVRLILMTFLFKSITSPFSMSSEDYIMLMPMQILFVFTLVAGSAISWMFFPWVFVSVSPMMKLLIIFGLSILFMLSFLLKGSMFWSAKRSIWFFSSMWLLPTLTSGAVIYYLNKSLNVVKVFDQGWLEYAGGQGAMKWLSTYSSKLDFTHVMNLKTLLLFICSISLLLLYLS